MARNLTPEHLRCEITSSCPSVHRLDDGRLFIVGKVPTYEEIRSVRASVGPDEFAVTIGPEYLANIAADA
jgi:hypothetical protein